MMNLNSQTRVPDISVVMAVKNESKYIKDAVDSILSQEGLEFEIIVVDDNSTDGTLDIAEVIGAQHPRLRAFRNPRAGKVSAFNFGVHTAMGSFVCLFAGDDIMPVGSLAARWNKVKDLPVDKPVVGLYKIMTMSNDKKYDGFIMPRAKGKGSYNGQSPLMNQQMVKLIFPIPEHLPNEDTWMELAINYLTNVVIVHSDIICCHWRFHEGNSYNIKLNYNDFRRHRIDRQRAFQLFYNQFKTELSDKSRQKLSASIEFNRQYERESVKGIIFSSVDLTNKLRALSSANTFLYNVRNQFYGIFSGW